MKKFIITIMLVICFSSSALAIIPVVLYSAPALISYATVGATVWFASQTKISSGSVTASGTLAHSTTLQWLSLASSIPQVITKDATVKVSMGDVATKVNSNPTKYPNLKTALSDTGVIVPALGGNYSVGSIVDPPDQSTFYRIDNVTSYGSQQYVLAPVYYNGMVPANSSGSPRSTMSVYHTPQGTGTLGDGTPYTNYGGMYVYALSTVAAPTPGSATPSKFAQNLSGSASGGAIIAPAASAELDSLLTSESWPYGSSVIKYADTLSEPSADSAPLVTIPAAPSQAAIDAAKLADANLTAQSSALAAAVAAQDAYDLNPTIENRIALENARAASAQADAQTSRDALVISNTAAETAAVETATAETVAIPANNYDASIITPDKKSIGGLLASFLANSPIASMIQTFTISTSNASGVVSIPDIYGKTVIFDFTRWQDTFINCGAFLLILVHGFAVLVVVRGW